MERKKRKRISSYYRPTMQMILPDIMEESQYELLDTDNSAKSHETSFPPISKDYARKNEERESRRSLYLSVLKRLNTRKKSLNIDNSEILQKKLSSPTSKHYTGSAELKIIEEEQYQPLNFDNSDETNEKLSLTSIKDYARKVNILADDDAIVMKIMECNDPPKDKIINLPELSVKLSSMDSSSVKSSIKSFPTNSTEFLHTKLRYLDLFDNACEDYSMLLYNIYDNFYPIIESVELHLERYRIIIREYNKIIKSLNAIKIQNQSFRDDDANIMIENGKNNNESKDNQDKKKEIIQKTSYIMESFPAESCSMKLLDNEHYNATVKLFNNNIITIIYYLGDDILELTENINHICQCNIDFKQLVTQHKTHVKMFRDIVSNIMIKSNKSDNESKYDQDTKKEITYETYFRPISYILNPPFISENDQMKNTETEEIKNCTTNIHNNLSEQLDKPTETINNKKLIDITEFTSQSKFKEKLTWTSVAARCKLIIFLISLLLQIYKIIIILKKFILSKPITVTNNDRKDKKPEDIQVTKNEIRQKCPSQYFTILSISFLSIFLFLLYFYFGLSYIDQNDKCNDIFAPNIVELEKEILDHDKTIRILTEYLQRDTPLLKAVALIGGTNVDNSYTVDIIKKKLHRRNNNGFSSLHPNFIVLENLRAEHSTDVINFVRMHQKIYGNRQFIILAVFKIEQINDDSTYSIDMNRTINIVKNSFTEANIISKIIPFEPLSEEILEKYIISTAENIRQTFSREQIN